MPDTETPTTPDLVTLDLSWAWEKGFEIGAGILMATLILAIGWFVSRQVRSVVLRVGAARGLDAALMGFLAQIASYVVLAATAIAALAKVGVETGSVMAIFASAGLAVGLALQGSLSNFAAGVMILFFRPFTLGDVVKVSGETGGVTDIGLFQTTLINAANETIILGNASVIGNTITNFTRKGTRRATVGFGVAYGADIDQVCAVVEAAVSACPAVITDPAGPAVAFTDMAASSLNFVCHVWAASADYMAVQHQTRRAIYNALLEAGIEIPFDQVVVHQAPAAA